MNSCVYILVGRIKKEVQPYIWFYALAGTGLALEAIIITALASAYITAINRFFFVAKDNNTITTDPSVLTGGSEGRTRSLQKCLMSSVFSFLLNFML